MAYGLDQFPHGATRVRPRSGVVEIVLPVQCLCPCPRGIECCFKLTQRDVCQPLFASQQFLRALLRIMSVNERSLIHEVKYEPQFYTGIRVRDTDVA